MPRQTTVTINQRSVFNNQPSAASLLQSNFPMTRAGYTKPLPPTMFDYVLIGLNPSLIGIMVGSLGFFLITAFYDGDFALRLSFIMAMYVMGIVGTARISIERGTEYASLFAIPLAIVSMMAMAKFVNMSMLLSLGFLAILWFCAHRLTWDCTVVEDSEDTSGRGLLETAGLESGSNAAGIANAAPQADLEATTQSSDNAEQEQKKVRWWTKLAERARRPRAHGVWVIYFALGALPIFGFGQRFAQSLEARRYMLQLFCAYMASGLALLMTTSLVGLRMYLRRRRFVMQDDMTGVWVASGTALIIVTHDGVLAERAQRVLTLRLAADLVADAALDVPPVAIERRDQFAARRLRPAWPLPRRAMRVF
jgi:hypothetical protein